MSLTLRPASRSVRAVPPVEISSTPKPASALANSTSPVLSVTLSRARRIFFSALTFAPKGAADPLSTVRLSAHISEYNRGSGAGDKRVGRPAGGELMHEDSVRWVSGQGRGEQSCDGGRRDVGANQVKFRHGKQSPTALPGTG